MNTGFKGLGFTVMGALIGVALASCSALGPSDEPGADASAEGTGSPDLMVSVAVSADGPTVGAPFTLSATVQNAGDGASESTTLRYYQSTDAEISNSDTVVGTEAVAQLAASGTSSQSLSLTAPAAAGTYYYGACVEAVGGESDTANNCSSAVQITVPEPEPGPNLAVSSVSVSNSAPVVGTAFTVSALVQNHGDEDSAVTTMRFYRSTDATVTISDKEVGTADLPSLAPSATSSQSLSLTAPTTAGTYYYGACVESVTGESDTANNCSASVTITVGRAAPVGGAAPDLVVLGPGVSSGSRDPGEMFRLLLSATVTNAGDAASAATTLRYYRSTDGLIKTSDTQVGTAAVAELAASGTSSQSVSLSAPSTAGIYYYGACVDSVAAESETLNNCSESVPVEVTE